jgi:hypothetical protein
MSTSPSAVFTLTARSAHGPNKSAVRQRGEGQACRSDVTRTTAEAARAASAPEQTELGSDGGAALTEREPMKRIAVIVGVVLGVVGLGAMAAWAGNTGPSQWCQDGYPPGGEHDVTTDPVQTTYEVNIDHDNTTFVAACYSTTPKGSSAPETAGGHVVAIVRDDGGVSVWCFGDRTPSTAVTVDCRNDLDATTYPGLDKPTVTYTTTVGAAGFSETIGRTGVETGAPTVQGPNVFDLLAGNGNPTTSSVTTPNGPPCVYVDGDPECASTGTTVADMTVASGDIMVEYRTTLDACVGAAGNPCVARAPSSAAVAYGNGDPENDTIHGTMLGTPVTYDPGRVCLVNYNRGPTCDTSAP